MAHANLIRQEVWKGCWSSHKQTTQVKELCIFPITNTNSETE